MTRSKSSTIIFGFFRTLLSRLISYAKTVNPEPEHIQVSSTQLASDFFFTDSFTDYGTLTLLFQDHVWAPYPFLHFSKADTKKNDTQVGGLEVQNPHTLRFQPARPIVRTQGYLR